MRFKCRITLTFEQKEAVMFPPFPRELICVSLGLHQTCQVYARRSAEDVYKILTSQKTNYVILEDSLCNEYTHKPACRMKDLLDISNGHVSPGTPTRPPHSFTHSLAHSFIQSLINSLTDSLF